MRCHEAVVFRLGKLSLGIEPGDLRGQLVFSEFVIDIGLALKEGYRIVEFRYDRFCLLPLRGLGRDLLIETIDLRLVLRELRSQLPTLRIGESWVCARRGDKRRGTKGERSLQARNVQFRLHEVARDAVPI